jgi:pyruvate dehydrogenase E2 component (dihydrolipoamide acetyltransferase)
MQEDGFVAKLLYPEGAKDVKLGSPVCILAFNEKDIPAFADWVPGDAPSATETAAEPQSSAQSQT